MSRAIFLILLAVSAAPGSAAPAITLPQRVNSAPGFAAASAQENYTAADLYVYIDGAADVYLEAGMQSCAVRVYADVIKGGGEWEVAAYRMGSDLEAFGIFRQLQPPAQRSQRVGTESAGGSRRFAFWKGTWYVEVTDRSPKPMNPALMESLGAAVAQLMPGNPTRPAALALLPDSQLIAGSQRYWRGGFLSRGFLSNVVAAEYAQTPAPCTLFVMTCPDDSTAQAKLAGITEAFADGRRVQALASRNRIAGCVSCSREQWEGRWAGVLIERLRRQ